MIELPDKLLGKVGQQAAKAEKRLQQQSQKYLSRIKKQEKRLYATLYKKDSSQAKALFGNIDLVYAQMEQSTTELSQNSGPRQHYYYGRLDSVQTSLGFLAQEQLPGVQAKLPKQLLSALGSYNQLQNRLTKSTYIEYLFIQCNDI